MPCFTFGNQALELIAYDIRHENNESLLREGSTLIKKKSESKIIIIKNYKPTTPPKLQMHNEK